MLNSNLKTVLFYSNKKYLKAQVRSDDAYYVSDIDFMMKYLYEISINKSVFIDHNGDIRKFEEGGYIIEKKPNIRDNYKLKIWVKNEWLRCEDKSFADERYTTVYLFESTYDWNAYISNKNINITKEIKRGNLYAAASFGDCDHPDLYIKNDSHHNVSQFLQYFEEQGYAIRNQLI